MNRVTDEFGAMLTERKRRAKWGSAVAAAPRSRLPWTAFFISWAIGSAGWVVAQIIERKAEMTKSPPEEGRKGSE